MDGREAGSNAERDRPRLGMLDQSAVGTFDSDNPVDLAVLSADETKTLSSKRISAAQSSDAQDGELDALESKVARLLRNYENTPPRTTAGIVVDLQHQVDSLLAHKLRPSEHMSAVLTASWLAAILANAAFDLGRYKPTWDFCDEALKLAQLVNAPELIGWIRLTQSTTLFYQGRYKDAIGYAQEGRRVGGPTPISARIASSSEAGSYAALGDLRGVHSAIDVAHKAFDKIPSTDYGLPGRYVLTLHPADLACHAANALTVAGDGQNALRYSREAKPVLDAIGPLALRSMVRIDEAMNMIRQPYFDVATGSALVSEALAISQSRPVNWIREKAREFLAEAMTLGNTIPSLQSVDEEIHNWTIA